MRRAASMETFVRDALESFTAAQRNGRLDRPQPTASSKPRGPLAAVAAVLATLVLVAVGCVIVVIGRAVPPGCEPITYTLQGSPPINGRAEFSLAIEEIHQRSGLVFEAGDPDASKLLVTWSDRGLTSGTSSPAMSDHGSTRLLGFGGGRWQSVHGGRELVDGFIQIDATVSWPLGADRGDGLAVVIVHELGHVIGLTHSPEPTSFMYHVTSPEPPRWTAHDLDQLAQAGRQSGCRPPQASV